MYISIIPASVSFDVSTRVISGDLLYCNTAAGFAYMLSSIVIISLPLTAYFCRHAYHLYANPSPHTEPRRDAVIEDAILILASRNATANARYHALRRCQFVRRDSDAHIFSAMPCRLRYNHFDMARLALGRPLAGHNAVLLCREACYLHEVDCDDDFAPAELHAIMNLINTVFSLSLPLYASYSYISHYAKDGDTGGSRG